MACGLKAHSWGTRNYSQPARLGTAQPQMPSSGHGSRQIRTTKLCGFPEGHPEAVSPAKQATNSLKASQSLELCANLEPTILTISFKIFKMFPLVNDYSLEAFFHFPPCFFLPSKEYILSLHQRPGVHQTMGRKGRCYNKTHLCSLM